MMKHIGWMTLLLTLATGCATMGHGHDEEAPWVSSPTLRAQAQRVRLLQTEADQPTEVLGLIDAHQDSEHSDVAMEELRERGAAMGADAVVGVEFHHGEGAHEPTHLSGVAVRYRDLLHGRQYDLIQRIDIASPMGEEEEAVTQLRARAWDLHADLIINIAFEHGDAGSGPTHLRGDAIRFR